MFFRFALLSILLFGRTGLAGDVPASEEYTKKSIQDAASEYICSSEPLLDTIELDARSCRAKVVRHGLECWQELDDSQMSYDFDDTDEGLTNLSAVTKLYVYCVQAKILIPVIDLQFALRNYQEQEAGKNKASSKPKDQEQT